jgi:hypothetical protein
MNTATRQIIVDALAEAVAGDGSESFGTKANRLADRLGILRPPLVIIDFTGGVEQARWTFAGEGVPDVIVKDFDPEGVEDERESYIDTAEEIAVALEARHLPDCDVDHGGHTHWTVPAAGSPGAWQPCPEAEAGGGPACADRYAAPNPCLLTEAAEWRERAAEWRADGEENERRAAEELAKAIAKERRINEIAEGAGMAPGELVELFGR